MSNLRILIDCLYEESENMLREMQRLYRTHYRRLTPRQRRNLRVRIKELAEFVKTPDRRRESLAHRAVAGVLDACYHATYRLVGKILPPRRKA